MTIATDADELTAINTAIEAILTGGQDLSIRENSVRKANLETLYKRKDVLTARIARTARGGTVVRGATPV